MHDMAMVAANEYHHRCHVTIYGRYQWRHGTGNHVTQLPEAHNARQAALGSAAARCHSAMCGTAGGLWPMRDAQAGHVMLSNDALPPGEQTRSATAALDSAFV